MKRQALYTTASALAAPSLYRASLPRPQVRLACAYREPSNVRSCRDVRELIAADQCGRSARYLRHGPVREGRMVTPVIELSDWPYGTPH